MTYQRSAESPGSPPSNKTNKPKKRRSSPTSVGNIIARLRDTVTDRDTEAGRLKPAWENAVRNLFLEDPDMPPQAAANSLLTNTEAARLEGSVLIVYASSPVWASRVRLSAPSLLARLAREAGLEQVDKLKIKIQSTMKNTTSSSLKE